LNEGMHPLRTLAFAALSAAALALGACNALDVVRPMRTPPPTAHMEPAACITESSDVGTRCPN